MHAGAEKDRYRAPGMGSSTGYHRGCNFDTENIYIYMYMRKCRNQQCSASSLSKKTEQQADHIRRMDEYYI